MAALSVIKPLRVTEPRSFSPSKPYGESRAILGSAPRLVSSIPSSWTKDWIVSPRTNLEVPWIWIRSLATAWEKYKSEGGPLGQAFGLEGGQGKPPISDKLMQMLDERLDLVTHPGDPSGWREDAHRRCRAGGRREIRQERRHDQTGLAAVRSA